MLIFSQLFFQKFVRNKVRIQSNFPSILDIFFILLKYEFVIL